ncbi:helix-turn-helix domain-containing protein [Pantoea agglomerans]|uniref:helix-turn-helix domain-containing protein n=1 Tax=Enterobacter agglomerans TaxID=549 RepID=UPI0024136AA4|nr:helix-turn-helix domain-containing protein [Pantoea agglomerans]
MSQGNYVNPCHFVMGHQFDNPLQRLILMRILSNGSCDGEGERIFNNDALAEFCCCSKQAMYKEIKNLERAGYLKVRKMGAMDTDLKVRLEPARGYTITSVTGDVK